MKITSAASAFVPLVLAAILASCSPGQNLATTANNTAAGAKAAPGGDNSRTFVYQCDKKFQFVAHLSGDTAWLFLPKRTVALRQMPTLTGAQYGDGESTFLVDGEYGWFRGAEGEYEECLNNRKKAVWEHAKLRGADYRAVGNEPGWSVEIWPEYIRYIGDYGSVSYTFERPEPRIDQQARTTVYETADADVSFTLQIRGEKCLDTMSDEEYSTAVTIWVDGRELRGCGKALH